MVQSVTVTCDGCRPAPVLVVLMQACLGLSMVHPSMVMCDALDSRQMAEARVTSRMVRSLSVTWLPATRTWPSVGDVGDGLRASGDREADHLGVVGLDVQAAGHRHGAVGHEPRGVAAVAAGPGGDGDPLVVDARPDADHLARRHAAGGLLDGEPGVVPRAVARPVVAGLRDVVVRLHPRSGRRGPRGAVSAPKRPDVAAPATVSSATRPATTSSQAVRTRPLMPRDEESLPAPSPDSPRSGRRPPGRGSRHCPPRRRSPRRSSRPGR